MKELAAIEDHGQRQFYARYTRELMINWSWKRSSLYHPNIDNLEFPRLKSIMVGICGSLISGHEPDIRQYIQPSLEDFTFHDKTYNPQTPQDVFYMLETRCPRLKRVEFDIRYFDQPISGHMIKLLHTCKSLKNIETVSNDPNYSYNNESSLSSLSTPEPPKLDSPLAFSFLFLSR